MANRIAKELRWMAKVSRKKERGEFDHHLYQYKDDLGMIENIGLVIWKDCKPVYVLTSECSTVEVDVCIRRSKQGLLHIDRPISVAQYNKYMGGVDVSEQKQLFCESRVHGLNRWWIQIFFYYIDIGTVNAMVLFCHLYNSKGTKVQGKN